MKITFNGTSSSEGFPALFCECEHCSKVRTMESKNFRMRTSCLIDEPVLIDFSADTYARSLYGKLELIKVRNLIITHSHPDHLYPIDLRMIRPPYAQHNRKVPLQVYGNKSVGNVIKRVGISGSIYDMYLQFNLMKAFTTYHIDDYEVTPLPANHDPNQECFIYVIEKNSRVLLYGHDSGYFLENTWAALEDCRFDGVILDCTSGTMDCPYDSHMGITENLRVKERMYKKGMANDQTKFILTHFAHTFGPFYESMGKAAAEKGLIASYDGFEIEI
jgi:phosphoribosyl 1,2-cyclic phosphate phosphodiesterase